MDSAENISREQLEQIAAGTLNDPEILARVNADPELLAQLEEIRRDNELLGELLLADATPAPAHDFDPIAGYELLDEIHRGGQGIVQRARQRSADRMVAVKTLLQGAFASDAQRHRFEREVRLVARLNHPSIVTVFESGRTALGSHYIVMELIDGEPVDVFAARLRDAGDFLGIARLFVEIADAVRYAHQRGVIHRDLKPGNILVDEAGRPHILDFGIARTFGDDSHAEPLTTRTGEFMGTLAYASPEQIASEPGLIDIRSDVYALGVLLYLALTGQRPIATAGSLAEVIARIKDDTPPAPSSINPAVEQDLDTITLTALAKSVSERYQTAGDLRDDLARWLEGRAISARAHDFWYVARKSLRRHRVSVAIASAFLLLIVGSAIVTGVLALKFQRENRVLNSSVRALANPYKKVDRETTAQPITSLQGLLNEVVENLNNEVVDRPDVESVVREAAGIAFLDDDLDKAEEQLVRAYELRRDSLTAPNADLATSLQNLGRLRFKQGRWNEARNFYQQALDMRIELFGTQHADVARTMHHLALTVQALGDLDGSREYWEHALRIRRAVLEPNHSDIGNALSGLATNSLERGDYEKAETAAREALRIVLNHPDYGPDSLAAGRVAHNLGIALRNLGRLDEAESVFLNAIRIKELTENGSVQLARSRGALGRVYFAAGQLDKAQREGEAARAIRIACGGRADEEINPELLLSEILLARNDPRAAEQMVNRAITALDDGRRPALDRERGLALAIRARARAQQESLDAARADAVLADEILSLNRTDRDPAVLANLRLLASICDQRDDPCDAIVARIRAAESATPAQADQTKP